MSDEKYLMLQDLSEFIRERRGIRVALSSLEKMVAPANGSGPPVASRWGRRPLFRPADVLAWADARMQPVRSSEAA